MAEKKKTKALAKGSKSSKGAVKKSIKGSLSDKTNKLLARQKVTGSGLSAFKKAKFNVNIILRQVKEVYGFLAEVTDHDITIKGRPVTGKGRKDHFNVIQCSDIVAFEGSKGSACKAMIQVPTTIATYQNCTYTRKANGFVELTTESGELVTIVPSDNVRLEIAAAIEA